MFVLIEWCIVSICFVGTLSEIKCYHQKVFLISFYFSECTIMNYRKNENAFKPFTNWFLIRKLVLIYYLVILYVYWKIFQINAPTRSGMYITQKCYAHMLQLTVDSVETGNPSLTFSDTLLKQALRTM